MTALPTTPALDAAVAELVARCATWTPIGPALEAIRRMQFHATLESIGRVPSVTRGGDSVVLRMEDYRRLSPECHDDDDDGGRAA